MAPMSRGKVQKAFKVVKPRAKRCGTASGQKHRFESFSQRIAKLNIDPVRKTHHQASLQDGDSHFRASFDEWRDVNISQNFRDFAREVDPLTQSLPQILHHQDQILDLLIRYLLKKDVVSLEALLSLVAHFAHDLGLRFETHFKRTVETISDLASTCAAVDVIDWSFNCLAWLFKYLSRLLVPDLRPLYDLMAPLLGKRRQKPFVSRFAAEAMSFLIRKAGARYQKEPEPLDLITAHAFDDLQSSCGFGSELLPQGLAVMFAESTKGVRHSINSSGRPIYEALLKFLFQHAEPDLGQQEIVIDCVRSIFVSNLHHATTEGFLPIEETVLDLTEPDFKGLKERRLALSSRVFLWIIGTRKGSRISQWERVLTRLREIIGAIDAISSPPQSSTLTDTLVTMTAALQYCPFELAIKFSNDALPSISRGFWESRFLNFCTLVSELGSERFQSLVQPTLSVFIAQTWEKQEEQLCLLLPKLLESGSKGSGRTLLPPHGQTKFISRTQALLGQAGEGSLDYRNLHLVNRYLDIPSQYLTSDTIHTVADRLYHVLRLETRSDSLKHETALQSFILTRGVQCITQNGQAITMGRETWSVMIRASGAYGRSPRYLEALLSLASTPRLQELLTTPESSIFVESLSSNLASPAHILRYSSLKILHRVSLSSDKSSASLFALANKIEETDVTVENIRILSMYIRKLPALLQECASDDLALRAIPAYCFGMLQLRLAPIWEDVCGALQSMVLTKEVEEQVMRYTVDFLQRSSMPPTKGEKDQEESRSTFSSASDLECTNLLFLQHAAKSSFINNKYLEDQLREIFESEINPTEVHPFAPRTQALRVLSKIPWMAEKRSRTLVPIFLDWFGTSSNECDNDFELGSDEETLPSLPSPPPQANTKLSLEDKKGMLTVFSQFVNPFVVFRQEEVYSTLLGVLQNGDIDIQRLALRSVLAWKSPSRKPYEENLFNLLDESKFRDELTTFLGLNQGDSFMQRDHRAEMIPVVLRLLYGRLVSRTGSKARGGQEARRKATLGALARSGNDALGSFLQLILEPLDEIQLLSTTQEGVLDEDQVAKYQHVTLRKQLGTLRMVSSVLAEISQDVRPFAFQIMDAILFCVILSSRKLDHHSSICESDVLDLADASLLRAVRREGLICLISLLSSCSDLNWRSYRSIIGSGIIRPKLQRLAVETAQSVSILLKLLATCSRVPSLLFLFAESNCAILRSTNNCLVVQSAQETVKSFVLREIIANIVHSAESLNRSLEDSLDAKTAIVRHLREGLAYTVADHICRVIEQSPGRDCLEECVSTLTATAPYVEDSTHITRLVRVAVHLLKQPTRQVNLLLKSKVMHFLRAEIPHWSRAKDDETCADAARSISSLFSYFKDGPNRSLTAEIFQELSSGDQEMESSAKICFQLNSFSSSRLDEPDYEARLQAFREISDPKCRLFTAKQWQPLVHNLLYLIRDDELSMRANASLCLRSFVNHATSEDGSSIHAIIAESLFPALCRGMREPSELVRTEYVSVLAELVKREWQQTRDMQALLGPDEESSFFENFMHIQEHRRLRALRRLAAESAHISSGNISRILLPMIETIIAEAGNTSANVVAEALNTLGPLCKGLEWPKYRSLLQRIVKERNRFDSKLGINFLAKVVDGISNAHQAQSRSSEPLSSESTTSSLSESTLSKTLPNSDRLLQFLSQSILPTLLEYIHFKDESTVDLRIGVAVSAVKLVMTLPREAIEARLPSILMDICNILKGKAQEARDAARKTLAEVVALVGASYFGFILKQLRSSLQRGSHLHVLSYTVHSLLVSVSKLFKPGELDYCLQGLMAVIIEDTFGATGSEKEAEDYISKMKEVRKKNLSYDSIELLASFTSIPHVSTLLEPIRDRLRRPGPRLEKAEELLRRIREGLRRNDAVNDRASLTLCYQVLKETIETDKSHSSHKSSPMYKMALFGFDLLRRIIDKHESLKTADNLNAFMPKIGLALKHCEEEVQIAAMRVVISMVKLPLFELDANAGDYLKSVRRIIEAEPSTSTPLSQAALRLISALLRERPHAIVKQSQFETHVAFLLDRVRPDLSDPARSGDRERQVAAFNFLKAVLGRGVLIKEVYDVMDTVREVMITSQDHPVPDLARSVYSRFILDYFPDEGRGLAKQVDYLVSNLQYSQPSGRQSVMEVVLFVLGKKSDAAVQSLCVDFFLSLLLVLVTDSSEDCRSSARILLQKVFQRADGERMNVFKSQLRKWIDPTTDELWRRVGFQCWGVYFEVFSGAIRDAKFVAPLTQQTIQNSGQVLKSKGASLAVDALSLLKRMCSIFPSVVFSHGATKTWAAIEELADCEQTVVQLLSSELVGLCLTDVVRSTEKAETPLKMPLTGSKGLELTKESAAKIERASISMMKGEYRERLVEQAMQNLALLGRLAIGANAQDVLGRIISQACAVVRLDMPEHSKKSKFAALRLLNALCKSSPNEVMKVSLHSILQTLNNLTDDNIPTSSITDPSEAQAQEKLVSLARELLGALQSKLGTMEFVTEMQRVQHEVKERREGRRVKRRIETVSAPERAGREKQRKNEAKKVKRREKNALAAGRRRGW